MYQDLFDEQRQTAMRQYFLQNLAGQGIIRRYQRRELIDLSLLQDCFAIVCKGKVVKSILSSSGQEKLLYTLRPGEIFGEMAMLNGGFLNYQARVKEDCELACISRELLAKNRAADAKVHDYIMNSITRKFRIVLLQLTNTTFNDAHGRIADLLIRLAACADDLEDECDGRTISTHFTQQELAQNAGCSRITVSRTLQRFSQENLITISKKRIVIKDLEGLARYTDRVQ
ncbi:Crp/Fnr family transcriptional regulator [Azotosporobacter soli]|uniref:Crp/Fnr family transcriptional regulator n=1 Tax=Azotosporobacter soli TaxID=3055040 RepID=UPI0031FEF369